MSTVLCPLYDLLKRKQRWYWGEGQKTAFSEAKQLILSSLVLVRYDPSLKLQLACDASDYGIGAVLSHQLAWPMGRKSPLLLCLGP